MDFRDDDFSGIDPEAWLVLHPELADATIAGGELRLRPHAYTAWYGSSEAYHRHVLVAGDFAVTSRLRVGDLQGGPASPDWRLGGLLLRDPGPGAIDAYHAAFGTVAGDMHGGMVAEYKSTVSGGSELGFVPHATGAGELRVCRVGATVRSVFRPEGATQWTLIDQRERPDLPAALAVGPMAYAYAPVGDFEAAFDEVNFDALASIDDCENDPSEGDSSSSSSEGDASSSSSEDGSSSSSSEDGSSSSSSEGDSSSSGGEDESSSGGGDPGGGDPPVSGAPTDPPTPTTACPPISDGIVTLCPAALGGACRQVLVHNAAAATGDGPLQVHWHGTYEWPEGLLSWDWATQQIQAMTIAEGGVLVLPYADPAAVARSGPFPWWVVGDPEDPLMQTDRDDDVWLFDEAVACVLQAGLASPDRINTSGMSAGGIMTSHLVDRRGFIASAVSWSGGLQAQFQPALPPGPTAVMAVHGGPADVYCGVGVPGGGCHSFVEPSEALAADVALAGNWAFSCDHQAGHSAALGGEGAQFMAAAVLGAHPWEGYPFGSGGHWMLDHYCYASGDPSPWQ